MPEKIRDVMTASPVVLDASAPIVDAARAMREENIGTVMVREGTKFCGIVTDRDLVVRGLAEGNLQMKVGDVCSKNLVTVSPDDPIDKAVTLMKECAVRRLPVVEGQEPIGIISIGDLATEKDPQSALGEISAAPPNR